MVRSDLYRHTAGFSVPSLLKYLLLHPGFQYAFWMRTCAYMASHAGLRLLPSYLFARWILRHYSHKYGIYLPYNTSVGPGLYIAHFGGIYVYHKSRIGSNFTIDQEIVLGKSMRGPHKGAPVIGDNVYVGPGAKIIGNVRIGNHAAIGANSVVTKDVPDHAVAAGVPARVISEAGSTGYVIKTWPPV